MSLYKDLVKKHLECSPDVAIESENFNAEDVQEQSIMKNKLFFSKIILNDYMKSTKDSICKTFQEKLEAIKLHNSIQEKMDSKLSL